MADWHESYDNPRLWRDRVSKDQKRFGWERQVRMEKILCTVLNEADEQQVMKTMDTLSERPEGFYRGSLEPVW